MILGTFLLKIAYEHRGLHSTAQEAAGSLRSPCPRQIETEGKNARLWPVSISAVLSPITISDLRLVVSGLSIQLGVWLSYLQEPPSRMLLSDLGLHVRGFQPLLRTTSLHPTGLRQC